MTSSAAVPLKTGENFDTGTPVTLFQAYPRQTVAAMSEQFLYDVSQDGQKFLINTQVEVRDSADVGCPELAFQDDP